MSMIKPQITAGTKVFTNPRLAPHQSTLHPTYLPPHLPPRLIPGASLRKVPTRMVEKIWGRDELPAPFAAPRNVRIGEIWFEPPPEMPDLLVKYLFTSEKLSVQGHPSSAQALCDEAGKEECWLVLDAEPGAQLAIGFDRQLTPEVVEAAAFWPWTS